MSPTLRRLLQPLNLAAYLAWLAIGGALLSRTPNPTGWWPTPWVLPTLLALHGLVLALFVGVQFTHGPARARALVFAQLAAALAMVAIARDGVLPILMVIAMAQLAQLLPPRGQAIAFLVVNAIFAALLWGAWKAGGAGPVFLVTGASFQLFAMTASWYAVSAQRSRDTMAELNAELLSTRSLLAASVRDSERLRIARELHDVAGHSLTALKLNLAALQRQPAYRDEAQLALCTRLADELLADLRAVVQQMRLHDGLELRRMIEGVAAPFPKPRLHLDMPDELRVERFEQAEAVLRTVQEALTNAARHGAADNLWLALRREDGALRLEARDDGRGQGELRFGNGLTGMRERLRAIGGDVQADALAGGGVRLSAWLPLAGS
jgi:signal transduction histidine kinase